MTSFGNEEIAVEAMKSGALDYIVKSPEAFSEMPRLVERALREWRLLQERKQADGALRVLLERYRQLVENANEAIVVAQDGRLKFVNPMACEITGYPEEELASLPFVDLVYPNDREMVVSLYLKRLKGDPLLDRYVFRILTKGGAIKWVEIGAGLIEWEDQPATLNLLTDITARKQAEEALLESEAKLRSIFRAAPVGIGVDSNRVILEVNETLCRMTGYSRDELIGQEAKLLHPTTEDYDYVGQEKYRQISEKGTGTVETRIRRKDGEIIHVLLSATPIDKKDLKKGVTFTVLDITERKQVEEALRRSEGRFKELYDNAPIGYHEFDAEGRITRVNRTELEMLGYTKEEMLGRNIWDFIVERESEEVVKAKLAAKIPLKHPMERTYRRKDGTDLSVLIQDRLIKDEEGRATGIRTTIQDITERKRVEEALRESEEKYRNLFENAVEGIFRTTPEGRFLIANPALARIYGYDSPEEMIESITDLAGQVYADPEERQAFTRAMEEEGEVKGYELQLKRKDGSGLWVSMNARVVRDEAGEILYYEGLAEDITPRKKSEEKLLESLESLRRAMRTTIQVMVAAVETRDPYTAGHQKRVTDLARALAKELGLDQETIEGIRMAGSIHDLGKISVPAEILSKPTKLTEIEFALIKAHSQYGYEILKDVESPWPLADMVLQHHERMDGSGYPQGLMGEAILLEARILAVADVVESISSHRPYRPGHGIAAALEEIEQNAGVLYDRNVVEACLRLFREKGFRFE